MGDPYDDHATGQDHLANLNAQSADGLQDSQLTSAVANRDGQRIDDAENRHQNGDRNLHVSDPEPLIRDPEDVRAQFLILKHEEPRLIAQLREVMLRTKMEADDAVRRAEFHRALEIMEQLAQNKIAAKQFQDYVKKLKDIDAILTPNQH